MSGHIDVPGRSAPSGNTPGGSGKAVVTGAAGFIGCHLVTALRDGGTDVVGIDRRDTWEDGETERAGDRGSLRAVHGDLVSLELEPLLSGVGTVFHLAALPGVRPSWTRFPEYLHCNVLATQRLMDACARTGVRRVVVASSSSVYGGPGESGTMSEDQVPSPLSPYGVTKLAAERLALAFAARDDISLDVRALRFFTVYGPGQRPDMLITRMIRAALEGAPLAIHGDGTQIRDFVHVSDVVRALTLAGAVDGPAAASPYGGGSGGGSGEVLNIGTGNSVSVNEVLALTAELTGRTPDARYGPARAGDAAATAADTGRARERLGFTAAVDIRTGLAGQIEWARHTPAPAPPAPSAPSAAGVRTTAGA
ncbi:NAD-dependent epimerase/dehydratase family protein [Streptomyces clavuligerus]|uniref:NAD-dependent epimerase/dehydratase MoeE5 n=1 Tax=Streptomyces clavuligerus TaxID=1901 RepID=D5SLH1_STRCL|nr:NAD-dependent epimerase/dehydratase MoeE5 [Streptomyces clavuligerus]MBY6306788.1 NAD-dependent epimerase/dehydratase family protein [Streptomyces clavuligerus]